MEKSQTLKELASALNSFQSKVESVKKDGENPYFKSKYATLENIVETIRKPLEDCGLSFSQFPTGENELVTILMHNSGEFLQSTVKMSPKDNSPQGQGSAITYMRRYALSAILGIATEDDDDGNVASKPKVTEPAKKAPAKTPEKKPTSDKAKIAHLCKLLEVDMKAEGWKEEVKKLTSLEVVEANYKEIIARLEVVVSERKN